MNGPVQNEQLNVAVENAAQHHEPNISGLPNGVKTITPEQQANIDDELKGIGAKIEGEHALAAKLPDQKEEPEATLNHGLDPNNLEFDDSPRLLHVIETGRQNMIKNALSEKDSTVSPMQSAAPENQKLIDDTTASSSEKEDLPNAA